MSHLSAIPIGQCSTNKGVPSYLLSSVGSKDHSALTPICGGCNSCHVNQSATSVGVPLCATPLSCNCMNGLYKLSVLQIGDLRPLPNACPC